MRYIVLSLIAGYLVLHGYVSQSSVEKVAAKVTQTTIEIAEQVARDAKKGKTQ